MKPLSAKEVAARLGVSPRTAQRWLKSGEIRAFRVGRKAWRTTPAELDHYLAGRWNRAA